MRALAGNAGGMRSQAGVTIIELLIVMGLLGLLASLALPRLNLTRYRLESAMLGVGTTLLAAQRLAVVRQHDVIVTFDVANQALRVHQDADNDAVVDAGERLRSYPLDEHVVYGRGAASPLPMGTGPVTFTKTNGGLPALTFHRNGSASEARGLYLTSTRAAAGRVHPEDSRALELDRGTGRVNWYRYGPPAWRRGF